jgi:hypothetical protein
LEEDSFVMVGDIRHHLEASPFEAFTIVTSSGRRYPVPSADHAGLNPQGTRVVVWFDDEASVTVAGLHIAAIEKGIVSVPANGDQGAAPNGGPATPPNNSTASEGPPSVS